MVAARRIFCANGAGSGSFSSDAAIARRAAAGIKLQAA